MTPEDFVRKYGTEGLSWVVAQFIQRAPEFKGDTVLAKTLGEMTADLESALAVVLDREQTLRRG
jgi:hypothetical protein